MAFGPIVLGSNPNRETHKRSQGVTSKLAKRIFQNSEIPPPGLLLNYDEHAGSVFERSHAPAQ